MITQPFDRTSLQKVAEQLLDKLPTEKLLSAIDYLRYLDERKATLSDQDLERLLAIADDEIENEVLVASGILPRLIAEAKQEAADPDWETTIDEL